MDGGLFKRSSRATTARWSARWRSLSYAERERVLAWKAKSARRVARKSCASWRSANARMTAPTIRHVSDRLTLSRKFRRQYAS